LIKTRERRSEIEQRAVRQKPPEKKTPEHPLTQRTLPHFFESRPRRTDELAVGYSGWARRLARPAVQTAIQVFNNSLAYFHLAIHNEAHEINAPAGRVHLVSQDGERRAACRAETAVDAVLNDFAVHPSRPQKGIRR
jgi:hypothetical protein